MAHDHLPIARPPHGAQTPATDASASDEAGADHSMWWMVLCCAPMVLFFVVIVFGLFTFR